MDIVDKSYRLESEGTLPLYRREAVYIDTDAGIAWLRKSSLHYDYLVSDPG